MTLALAPIAFVDAAFAGAPSTSCKFKVKNSSGGRVRVCTYNNDDTMYGVAKYDQVLDNGSWAWFDCKTNTCKVKVQWHWEPSIQRGMIDTCTTGYRQLFTPGSVDVLAGCNDVNIILTTGGKRKIHDAGTLEAWTQ